MIPWDEKLTVFKFNLFNSSFSMRYFSCASVIFARCRRWFDLSRFRWFRLSLNFLMNLLLLARKRPFSSFSLKKFKNKLFSSFIFHFFDLSILSFWKIWNIGRLWRSDPIPAYASVFVAKRNFRPVRTINIISAIAASRNVRRRVTAPVQNAIAVNSVKTLITRKTKKNG